MFSLWRLLFKIDEETRDKVQAAGCPFCGKRLDRANYRRKPRGGPNSAEDLFCLCFSLCCSSCRRRTKPASTRFLGRRVYLGVIVVLVAALRQGLTPKRIVTLTSTFGASRRTIERWCRWWQENFLESPRWRELRGRLLLSSQPVPQRIVSAFDAQKDPDNQAKMMVFLNLSTP